MRKIRVITMGGTIDAAPYSEIDGEYPVNATMDGQNRTIGALQEIFVHARDNIKLEWKPVCDKDSKFIDGIDRRKLQQLVEDGEQQGCERIIVTMGTDRMCETAREVARDRTKFTCPIIFTGAIWPLANPDRSDGWRNLGRAAFSLIEKPEVLICMGGILAPANHVIKEFKRMVFVDVTKDYDIA